MFKALKFYNKKTAFRKNTEKIQTMRNKIIIHTKFRFFKTQIKNLGIFPKNIYIFLNSIKLEILNVLFALISLIFLNIFFISWLALNNLNGRRQTMKKISFSQNSIFLVILKFKSSAWNDVKFYWIFYKIMINKIFYNLCC